MAEPVERVELVILDDYRKRRGGGGEPPGGEPPSGPGGDGAPQTVFASEDHLAVLLVHALDDEWRCAAGQWHRWDGRRWAREETKLVWEISRRVCRHAAVDLDNRDLARKTARAATFYAVARIAEADRAIAMTMHQFDQDRWLLNTPDGIVDLRSGQLLPHDRDALMTKLAGAGPMPTEDEPKEDDGCPLFRRYLDEATGGDKAMQDYLLRVMGYCLTGSIEEHCILFLHGSGGTGKSTFLLVLQDMLGDYAINAPMNVFTVQRGERHPTELARMAGARVVTASEIDEGERWDEGKLKAISGGDKITAHFMRQDDFTYEPQFKLIIAGNHRPRMRSADDAMRRRMQVIPFVHKPKTADKQLREKLRGELGAIMRLALRGEAERRRLGGLAPPKAVVEATNAYFRDENTLGRWIDERCDCGAEYWTERRVLYADFMQWARGVGEYVLPERIFSQKLEQMPGCIPKLHSRSRRTGFGGLALRFATPDLFETQEMRGRGRDGERRGSVRANELPLEAAPDEGDDYER